VTVGHGDNMYRYPDGRQGCVNLCGLNMQSQKDVHRILGRWNGIGSKMALEVLETWETDTLGNMDSHIDFFGSKKV